MLNVGVRLVRGCIETQELKLKRKLLNGAFIPGSKLLFHATSRRNSARPFDVPQLPTLASRGAPALFLHLIVSHILQVERVT